MQPRTAEFEVRESLDIHRARAGVRKLAAELGFPARACDELAIVTSELSSNIVKYGVRGSVAAAPAMEDAEIVGIVITASDVGPRFRDFQMALRDGCDDRGPLDPAEMLHRGGLGAGLGAVQRMTDSIALEYDERGKRVVATRFLHRRGQR